VAALGRDFGGRLLGCGSRGRATCLVLQAGCT